MFDRSSLSRVGTKSLQEKGRTNGIWQSERGGGQSGFGSRRRLGGGGCGSFKLGDPVLVFLLGSSLTNRSPSGALNNS